MPFSSPTPDPIARSSSVRARRAPHSSGLQCCCGRPDCILLKRNCSVLETVEKDVHTAAQLGQALLARHEAYMADAERDRAELNLRIERLELDKLDLEAANLSRIEENRRLLDQLEALNNTISDSDTKTKSLEASLLSSQQTVRRLEAAAARAADAERHIAVLEEEQDKLHQEMRSTKEDARTHAQRFKEAQRGILDMQDQLERIEKEAYQERQRHAEAFDRMERQREIDKQLDMAAGRLKGAAATKSFQDPKNGSKIVGHFVRDLLEDNANLQLGIAELRELLLNSNDEIQSLREQLMFHQPLPEGDTDLASTLKSELEPQQDADDGSRPSKELHIHHHYHVPPIKPDAKKQRKKRHGLLPGVFTPPALSAPSSPRRPGKWGITSSPTAPALLSHVSGDTTPTLSRPRNSWAGSSNPPSEFSLSVPGSPSQPGGGFDNIFSDSDPMTSPATSFDPMSPTWRASHNKRPSVASTRSFQSLSLSIMESTPDVQSGHLSGHHTYNEHTIHEEDEENEENEENEEHEEHEEPHEETHEERESLPQLGQPPELLVESISPIEDSTTEDSEYSKDYVMPRPLLRRVASHESIMSLTGGLDIHTLKSRPSQMTLRPLGGADAVVTGVIAQPTLSRACGKRSDAALRDHFIGFQSPRSVSSPISQPFTPMSSPASQAGSRPFGRWVGWRPWGGGSSPVAATGSPKPADKQRDPSRPPGINQPGSIPGFQQYWAAQKRKGAPAKVTTDTVDRDALVDGLRE